MNRELVLHNLVEGHDALSRMLEEARKDTGWGIAELSVEMCHLYHHINTAWNARASTNAVGEASDADFLQWSAFPSDLPLFE